MTIDELEGKALAEAVARAQGWRKEEPYPCKTQEWLGENGRLNGWYVDNYRPDRDIAQAWELDGEWLAWSFREIGLGECQRVIARATSIVANEDSTHDMFEAQARFDDFPTKSAAYATARCRAFLKAKAASR